MGHDSLFMPKPAVSALSLVGLKDRVDWYAMPEMVTKPGAGQVVERTHITCVGCFVVLIVPFMQGTQLLQK